MYIYGMGVTVSLYLAASGDARGARCELLDCPYNGACAARTIRFGEMTRLVCVGCARDLNANPDLLRDAMAGAERLDTFMSERRAQWAARRRRRR